MQAIKSPYIPPKKVQPKANLVDLAGLFGKMQELDNKIKSVDLLKEEIRQDHQDKMKELDATILRVLASIPKPKDGKDAPPVDIEAVARKAAALIPKPKDGITPEIDTLEIAKAAAKFVKVPEVKIPEVKIPEIDHATVADKVFELISKGKKKLSVKHIGDFTDGLEQTLRPIRSLVAGFRGGGDVVSAGSNITITTDANGKKVITASAGGFTTLTATETPNGATTVFTFAAATAQPSFIISDGVWMEPTGQDGVTVNWTWNNGTKKATMTIPPNTGIKGIV